MKLAIVSDIHGNLEAFRTVLKDINSKKVDHIISLGDNIGYGPEPEAVVRLLRKLEIQSVMGNHEISFTSPQYFDWFNELAKKSLLLTREAMSEASIVFCKNLPKSIVSEGCRFVHGVPPDKVMTYIMEWSTFEIRRAMKALEEDICFIGHTHLLDLYSVDGWRVNQSKLVQGRHHLPAGRMYLINVGSVGQPRDGNNNAKYVIWNTESRTLEVCFVPYNIKATADKIIENGWPEFHAKRLW